MHFSADLIARVRHALDSAGYCFLTSDEIQRLLAAVPHNRHAAHQALHEFARICGAEVEATPHLKSARFVPVIPRDWNASHSYETRYQPAKV